MVVVFQEGAAEMLICKRRLWSAALMCLFVAACGDAGDGASDEVDTGNGGRPDSSGVDESDDAGGSADGAETPAEDASSASDTGSVADTASGVPDTVATEDTVSGSPGDRALEPCGGSNGECAAGLDCLNTGSDGEGFCVLPCDGAACDDVRGEPAICALGVQGEPEPRYCVPLCDSAADCPAGISCKPVNETLSVCAP
jgi:hypothetical protein